MLEAEQVLGMIAISGCDFDPVPKYSIDILDHATGGVKTVPFAARCGGRAYVPIPTFLGDYEPIEPLIVPFPVKPVALREEQIGPVETLLRKRFGVFQGPAGSGKTICGLEVIRRCHTRALVVVPTIEIARQWIARAEEHLGLRGACVGLWGAGSLTVGSHITVATYQTAANQLAALGEFGLVMIDECHRAPCTSIRDILACCPAYYRYGTTATPWRADGLHRALDWLLGGVTAKIGRDEAKVLPVEITRFDTGHEFFGDYNEVQNAVASDLARNSELADTVQGLVVDSGHAVIALGNRLEQLQRVGEALFVEGTPYWIIDASTNAGARAIAVKDIRSGTAKVLLATYQLAAEGLDVPELSALVMLAPIGNPTKVEQACGRIARPCEGKPAPMVIDPVDQGSLCRALAAKRMTVYRKHGWTVKEK